MAQHRRMTVAATAGTLLVVAVVVIAAVLGNASAERSAAKSAIAVPSPIATLTDPTTDFVANPVDTAAFSPDGKILVTAAATGSTYLWKVPGAG